MNLPKNFIFLDNFVRLFNDPKIGIALRNTGTYMLVAILGVVPFAFMLGFFLSLRKPGYRILRTIFFSPSMLSVAALAMIFLGIYRPDGMLNSFLNSIGVASTNRVWLMNKSTALFCLIAIDIWGGIGFYSVLFFAAFASLPEELYEAAMLDGAGYWTILWKIAFPLMIDFIGIVIVLQFLGILSGAAYMILLTNGGPGTATFTLGFYLYDQAFLSHRLGYSQAIGVMLFFIGIVAIHSDPPDYLAVGELLRDLNMLTRIARFHSKRIKERRRSFCDRRIYIFAPLCNLDHHPSILCHRLCF